MPPGWWIAITRVTFPALITGLLQYAITTIFRDSAAASAAAYVTNTTVLLLVAITAVTPAVMEVVSKLKALDPANDADAFKKITHIVVVVLTCYSVALALSAMAGVFVEGDEHSTTVKHMARWSSYTSAAFHGFGLEMHFKNK
ncbi:unnamed protein product [Phaeothamnion confervicola]